MAEALRRMGDTQEFLGLFDRFQWGNGRTARVLGCNEKTVRRWRNGRDDVAPRALAYMREINAALEAILAGFKRAQDGVEDLTTAGQPPISGEAFAAAALTFDWDILDEREFSRPPFFADVCGLPPDVVRRIAQGKLPALPEMRLLWDAAAKAPEEVQEEARDRAHRILHPDRDRGETDFELVERRG